MNKIKEPYDFLNKLTGNWKLTGSMGEIPLQQNVTAKSVLGGLFIQMNFTSSLPASPGSKTYEAIYLIGYSEKDDRYVMNLFDTFGVSLNTVPGIGKRNNNSVEFVFQYETGPFINIMKYEADPDEWEFLQTYQQNGETKIFAVKKMSRQS